MLPPVPLEVVLVVPELVVEVVPLLVLVVPPEPDDVVPGGSTTALPLQATMIAAHNPIHPSARAVMTLVL